MGEARGWLVVHGLGHLESLTELDNTRLMPIYLSMYLSIYAAHLLAHDLLEGVQEVAAVGRAAPLGAHVADLLLQRLREPLRGRGV